MNLLMPDTTPTPPNKRKSPGPLDARLLQSLDKDEAIIGAALEEITADTVLAGTLASYFIDRDNTVSITVASLTTLHQQAAAAREQGGETTSSKAEFHSVTDDESAGAKTARAAIRGIQARAKNKYEESDPARLNAYFVGQPLRSRSQISLASAAIYNLVRTTDNDGNAVPPQDTLPGLTAAGITSFRTDLGSYLDAEVEQSGARKNAGDDLITFEDSCAQIARRRRKLQLAFDAERPYTDRANGPLRTRVGLPADKGMS